VIRKPKYINANREFELLIELRHRLLVDGINAGNTIIVTVSTDYSSVVGQYLRHALSFERDICDGFGIDVPFPDEKWDKNYITAMDLALDAHSHLFRSNKKGLLLVEAGVIRGGNYTYVTNYLKERYDNKVLTLALCENIDSVFKSDYVGEYYDNKVEDLTFWWEEDNKHWD